MTPIISMTGNRTEQRTVSAKMSLRFFGGTLLFRTCLPTSMAPPTGTSTTPVETRTMHRPALRKSKGMTMSAQKTKIQIERRKLSQRLEWVGVKMPSSRALRFALRSQSR